MRNVLIQIKGLTFMVCYDKEPDHSIKLVSILLDGVEVMPIIADDWMTLILDELTIHVSDRARRLKYSHDDCF